jgi:hypothetical protein
MTWVVHIVVVFLSFLVVINQYLWGAMWRPPQGLMVRLVRPETKGTPNPVIYPILVHVGFDGEHPTVAVNSRQVAWEELEAVLRRELLLRPFDWPVYVEGDRDLEWKWPARAIDVVQGLHVPIVLLTR